jgi:hypothetical protein
MNVALRSGALGLGRVVVGNSAVKFRTVTEGATVQILVEVVERPKPKRVERFTQEDAA